VFHKLGHSEKAKQLAAKVDQKKIDEHNDK